MDSEDWSTNNQYFYLNMGIKKFFAKLVGMDGSKEAFETPVTEEEVGKAVEEAKPTAPIESTPVPPEAEERLRKEEVQDGLSEGEMTEALKPLEEASERAEKELTEDQDISA